MSEWNLAETAPKDGSEFIMCDANTKTAVVGHWMADVEWRNAGKKLGEPLTMPSWFPLAVFTHWMPLPEIPSNVGNGSL